MPIQYFTEDVEFQLKHPKRSTQWIQQVINTHNAQLKEINYVFCSDDYLLDINRTHLNHDFYTDIITFDHSDLTEDIHSDIFISIDRVKENAADRGIAFEEEIDRVMIHGILHLLGFNDTTSEEKSLMRQKEDACLSLRKK